MAKCCSGPPSSLPRSQSSGTRDVVRVVGIVPPFVPREDSIRGNSFYRAPSGKWAQETCAGFPKQRYATRKPSNVQGRDRMGIVEGSGGYRVRGVSVRGKLVLSTIPGYKTRGIAMWLNGVLTTGKLTPK